MTGPQSTDIFFPVKDGRPDGPDNTTADNGADEGASSAVSAFSWAEACAAHGWPVLPVRRGDKRKRPHYDAATLAHGVHDATTDLDLIRTWAKRWPKANWAVRPPDGFRILDADAPGALDVLAAAGVPLVCCVSTGREGGGTHVYVSTAEPLPYKLRGPDGTHLGECLRPTRYAVLPGSVHLTGAVYGAPPDFAPWNAPALPAEAAERLRQWAEPPREQRRAVVPPADVTPGCATAYGLGVLDGAGARLAATSEGNRNDALWAEAKACGHYAEAGGYAEVEAWRVLWAACEANGAAKDDGFRRCRDTFERGWTAGVAEPKAPADTPSAPPPEDVASTIAAARSLANDCDRFAAAMGEHGERGTWRTAARVFSAYLDAFARAGRLTAPVAVDTLRIATGYSAGTVRAHQRRLGAAGLLAKVESATERRDAETGRVVGLRAASWRLSVNIDPLVNGGNARTGDDAGSEAEAVRGDHGDRTVNVDRKVMDRPASMAPASCDLAVAPATVAPRVYVKDGDGTWRRRGRAWLAEARARSRVRVEVRRSAAGVAYCGATGEALRAEALDPDRVSARGATAVDVAVALFRLGGTATRREVAEAARTSEATAGRHLRAFVLAGTVATDTLATSGRPATVYVADASLAAIVGYRGPVAAEVRKAVTEDVAAHRARVRARLAAGLTLAPDPALAEYRGEPLTAEERGKARGAQLRKAYDGTRRYLDALAYAMGAPPRMAEART